MSSRGVGMLLLLLASEALGLAFGEWATQLFRNMVPVVALSQFNENAAHIALLFGGSLMGLAIFVFALQAILTSRLFRPAVQPATVTVTPGMTGKN